MAPCTWCFGCMYGAPHRDAVDGNRMNEMLRIFEENYTQIDDRVLARLVHVYYMEQIRAPMLSAGMYAPVWRTRDILNHFVGGHINDARIFLGGSIGKYRRVSTALSRVLFKHADAAAADDGGNGAFVPDRENPKLMLLVDQQLQKLYAADTSKWNFRAKESAIDFRAVSRLVNVHREWQIT